MNTRPELWAIAVLAATLIAAGVTDVKTGRIWNVVTYPAIVVGLSVQSYLGGVDGLTRSLAGLAAGFGPLLICWVCGGIGGGDAKLMGAVGALTNWHFALTALFFTFTAAAVMAVVVMIRRRIVRRTLRRIWRSVCLALVPGVKGGGPADGDSPRIPFAVAACVGTAVALADRLLDGMLATVLLAG